MGSSAQSCVQGPQPYARTMINTQRSASSVKSAGSAESKNSDRSLGRYKKAGGGGADESLFGGQPAAVGSAAPSRKVEQMRKGPPSKVEYDSVVITAQDLARLRIVSDTSGALTTEQRERAAEMEAKAAAQATAKERRDRMIAMEAKRKANVPKSDLEVEDEENQAGLLDGAQRAKDENLDPVKLMNRQLQYAKCVTIRDAQLIEKQMLEQQRQQEEAETFRRTEEEQLKALQMLEEREQQKRAERMKGAQILQIQIQQAEQEKIRQAGILDQERQAMLKKMAEIDAQEQKKKQELKERNQQLLKEAAETNAAAIEQKKRKKQEAEEENLRIAAYIAERDRKEQERQDAIDEENRLKAEETARLRAMQQKMNDGRADRDALRAKRAAEDYERAWRAKERAEAEKKAAMLADILQSRKDMAEKKQHVLSQAAQMEKE